MDFSNTRTTNTSQRSISVKLLFFWETTFVGSLLLVFETKFTELQYLYIQQENLQKILYFTQESKAQ